MKQTSKKLITSTMASLMSSVLVMSSVGCKVDSSGSTPTDVSGLGSNETSTIGICKVAPATLSPEGRHVRANYSDSACAKMKVCLDPSAWQNLPQNKYIPGIDVVILFDVTGSMSPYIKAMISNIEQLMDNLSTLSPSVRIGLSSFRDFGDRSGTKTDKPFMLNAPLSSDVAHIKAQLSLLKATGGGDIQESLATAIKAVVDGKGMPGYFDDSNVDWQNDPTRIKIILGVTDAANRADNLPVGAPTLAEAAEIMKANGILFIGIGRKAADAQTSTTTTSTTSEGTSITTSKPKEEISESTISHTVTAGTSTSTTTSSSGTTTTTTTTVVRTTSQSMLSFDDLAYLARETRAIVAEPGIDLDGDGVVNKRGEVKPGEPAVLLMTSTGQLEGAAAGANPTRVLADAITLMVERVRPFQFSLNINSGGREFTPLSNVIAVPHNTSTQACFNLVELRSLKPTMDSCSTTSDVLISSSEELNGAAVDAQALRVKLEIDLTCAEQSSMDTPPATEPAPQPTPEPTPVTDPEVDPNDIYSNI